MQAGDRIKSRPLGFGDLVAVALLIALVVPAPAVRQALQQKRSPAGARLPQVVAECLPHPGDVAAVDGLSLEPIWSDHVDHSLDLGMGRARRELGKAVVL